MDRERTLMSLLSRLEALSAREIVRGETGASRRSPGRASDTAATVARLPKTRTWHILGGFVVLGAFARYWCGVADRARV
jgi:hypothetical protein